MSIENENVENGQVKISDDVVMIIAGIATSTVKGVFTAKTSVTDGITNLFSKNNYSKGIKVEINENNVVLDIYINVEYGCKISEVAREVQSTVKKEIETMTDLVVSSVNIHVQNIITEKEKDKEKDKIETDAIVVE